MKWTKIRRLDDGTIDQRQFDAIMDSDVEQVLLWDGERDVAELFECRDFLIAIPYMKEYTHYTKIEIPRR